MGKMISLDVLYTRDAGICWLCKKPCKRKEATRDHVQPKSLGGTNAWTNLRLAHFKCNSSRGNDLSLQDQINEVGEKTGWTCRLCYTEVSADWSEVSFTEQHSWLAHRTCLAVRGREKAKEENVC